MYHKLNRKEKIRSRVRKKKPCTRHQWRFLWPLEGREKNSQDIVLHYTQRGWCNWSPDQQSSIIYIWLFYVFNFAPATSLWPGSLAHSTTTPHRLDEFMAAINYEHQMCGHTYQRAGHVDSACTQSHSQIIIYNKPYSYDIGSHMWKDKINKLYIIKCCNMHRKWVTY